MRYVTIENLNEGMTLAQNVSKNRQMIIKSGTAISTRVITALQQLGYAGVFVNDDISEGTSDNISMIDTSVTENTAKCIKEIFDMPHTDDKRLLAKEDSLLTMLTENCVDDLVNEAYRTSSESLNLYDLKAYDDYTFYHSVNVSLFSAICATKLGYSEEQIKEVATAGLLHDIGKKNVPCEIINKTGSLTEEEFAEIKKHPRYGYDYVKSKLPYISCKIAAAILEHHEKMDGSGYPRGVTGDKICNYAKIVAVADVYDALTSKRSYRDAYLPSEAIEYLQGHTNEFDMEVVQAFIRCIYAYPIGTVVELSNKRRGIVISQNRDFNVRPIVKMLDTDEVIDLSAREYLKLTVTSIIKEKVL